MSNWHNQSPVYYQQDSEVARAGHRQADATERQNAILAAQTVLMEQQAAIAAAAHELEKERIRAQDLGITHADYQRRKYDHAAAKSALEGVEKHNHELHLEVGRQGDAARREIFRKKLGLYWRNRINLLRHPCKTRVLLQPYVARIERDVLANHAGIRRANQAVQAFASRVKAERTKVANLAKLL